MTVPVEYDDSAELKERLSDYAHRKLVQPVAVISSAENYAAINPGMVLRLTCGDYYILGEAKEGRFGIDDQPKMWVKYAIDLTDGSRKIIKLAFLEQFEINVGPFRIRCVRKPDKESRVLDAVSGDLRFMQGFTVYDAQGNNIRVIEQIRGRSLYRLMNELQMTHEEYFHERLPGLMSQVLTCFDALVSLHEQGLQHGDVRNDHIWFDADTGDLRWIDFDYEANYLDYDIWSVGNVVTFVVGQGIHTCKDAGRKICVEREDAMVFFGQRLANLRKLFPYIPEELNHILMRFSLSSDDFYESVTDIAADLRAVFPEA